MTRKPFKHVRQNAQKHHEEHARLKEVLNLPIYQEKILNAFIATFFVTLSSLIIFSHWGDIVGFFGPANNQQTEEGQWSTSGYHGGLLGNYKISDQTNKEYDERLANIGTQGILMGIKASNLLAKERRLNEGGNALLASVYTTKNLSKGQHLTELRQGNAHGLQKSVVTTFYLGEKTVNINSTLGLDTKLLSQVSNTLSVDIFSYLNQANSRADSLDSYLNLLSTLLIRVNERMSDLQAKITFLQANASAQEERIQISEEMFFNNINIFSGSNAEEELARFIGLQSDQGEIKAKLGAYQALYGYHNFFKPRLENLITAIKANRDALVAGVKVVEIDNMTLPLIIRN